MDFFSTVELLASIEDSHNQRLKELRNFQVSLLEKVVFINFVI